MTKAKPKELHKKLGPKGPSKWTEEAALELANSMIAWQLEDESHIYWEKFLVIDRALYPEIVSYLTGRYPSFVQLIKRAEKIQEYRLADVVGKGEIKSIFMMKNKHGYADKQDIKSESTVHQTVKDISRLKELDDDELKDSLRWLTAPPSKH